MSPLYWAAIVLVILLVIWYYRDAYPSIASLYTAQVVQPAYADVKSDPVLISGSTNPPPQTVSPQPIVPPLIAQPVVTVIPYSKFDHVGCYRDTKRYMGTNRGNSTTLNQCANYAKDAGFKYFGMQYPQGAHIAGTAECWYGNDTQWGNEGTAQDCISLPGVGPMGGANCNSVYKWN